MVSPLRGIFFDLDDTLIGYTEARSRALVAGWRVAAAQHPHITEDKLAAGVYGAYLSRFSYGTPGFEELSQLPTEELWLRLTEDALALFDISDSYLIKRMVAAYALEERTVLRAFPEVNQTLACLRPHFRLGIITNGPSRMQREKLAAFALEGLFDAIIVDTEFGHPKPDKRVFDYAAHRVGLRPQELLFVGNSLEDDIAGAHAAGWRCAWVNRDGSLLPAGAVVPDYTLTELSELSRISPVRHMLNISH